MGQGKLIVAALRLPVAMTRSEDFATPTDRGAETGAREAKPWQPSQSRWKMGQSAGGLVTGLKAVFADRAFAWIGWPGTFIPEEDRADVVSQLIQFGAAPVFLSQEDAELFYEDFSNRVVWPLFHGLVNRAHFRSQAWEAYVRANELYADEIVRQARAEDVVWVHDYQLGLLPEMLRERGLTCPVGFFLHVPFPSSELYRTLPVREALLRGLLGADLIGFHAYEYVSHFRKACLRVLGLESEPDLIRVGSRTVRFTVCPIGIDPEEVTAMAQTQEAQDERMELLEGHRGKTIIIGVDRLDYTKGIPEKMHAFEELLRQHPKWRERAVLIQVAAPSRNAVEDYRRLKREVDELVGRINGQYGTSRHTPIVYITRHTSRERLTGMYQAADIALITPIRDGMNLVALEYVAARAAQGGHLILSEFAGAANLLAGAKLVSPYDTGQVAEVLNECLEERATPDSTQHMLRFIEQNTSSYWADRFLTLLEASAADPIPPAMRFRISEPRVARTLVAAKKPLVLLDYDGTLRGYENKPLDAAPTSAILTVLEKLAKRADVYIVSGRDGNTLQHWLGHLPIGLVCEHGYAMRPIGEREWQRRLTSSRVGLRNVEPLFEEFVRRTPGSLVEKKRSSIAWHYRAADPEYATFQAHELLTQLEDRLKRSRYKVLRGSRVIEVRHEGISKGHATADILRNHPDADALFCAGDDRTDEDMMREARSLWKERAITCWVGVRSAHADYWIESSQSLLHQLSDLADQWPVRQ